MATQRNIKSVYFNRSGFYDPTAGIAITKVDIPKPESLEKPRKRKKRKRKRERYDAR